MFDAEKILGGLLLGGTRGRSSLDSLIPGGAGMALLGVAIEAFEHFTKKPAGGGQLRRRRGPTSAPFLLPLRPGRPQFRGRTPRPPRRFQTIGRRFCSFGP